MKTKRFGQPHITIALFLAVLFGLGAAFLLLPDRGFSAHENRYLAQAPKVTAETILSGDMTRDAENYINDQFPLRDRWIVCQAALSRAAGRRDNNGVYFGKDHTLIETFWTYDKERFLKRDRFFVCAQHVLVPEQTFKRKSQGRVIQESV